MGRGAALPERRGSVISSTKWLPHTTVDTVQSVQVAARQYGNAFFVGLRLTRLQLYQYPVFYGTKYFVNLDLIEVLSES